MEVFAMKTLIRARYDGRVLVPEEPLDLQAGQTVTMMLLEPLPKAEELSVEERLEALRRFVERGVRGVNLPDEALRRENIYEDRV
jgi:predicted DNA-binding antitoxin AbrB/MazE fold protein